eukprot:COSAG02_NODE_10678_length_1884_cov_104.592717_2_plen_70_part_00
MNDIVDLGLTIGREDLAIEGETTEQCPHPEIHGAEVDQNKFGLRSIAKCITCIHLYESVSSYIAGYASG